MRGNNARDSPFPSLSPSPSPSFSPSPSPSPSLLRPLPLPLLPSFFLRYLGNRLDNLQKDFKLRVVLCHVDVPDETRSLQEVTQISFNLQGSLVVVTSLEEAARYIETYVGKRREEKRRDGARREENGREGKRRREPIRPCVVVYGVWCVLERRCRIVYCGVK